MRHFSTVIAGFCSIALSACASGGGGSSPAPAPPPSPPPAQTNDRLSNLTVAETFTASTQAVTFATDANGGFNGLASAGSVPTLSDLNGSSSVAYDPAGDQFTITVANSDVNPFTLGEDDIQNSIASPDYVAYGTTQGFLLLLRTDNSIEALDYTSYGLWIAPSTDNSQVLNGSVLFGVQTEAGDVPLSGTATYEGISAGFLVDRNLTSAPADLRGSVELTANFASGSIDGTLSLGGVAGVPWGTVALDGQVVSGTNRFDGTANLTLVGSSAIDATGDLHGGFFGPNAAEVGGRWFVSNSDLVAYGAFAAGRQ